MDWRNSYHEGIDDRREELRRFRANRATVCYRVDGWPTLAGDLTDPEIEQLARELAAIDTEYTINRYNQRESDRRRASGLAL